MCWRGLHTPKYVLDTDIEKCFDRIDHTSLLATLQTFPRLRRLIKRWLKAGILDGEIFMPSTAGTPQGSPASPLLAHIALHGLEEDLHHSLPHRKHGLDWRPTVSRYVDAMVILHRDAETLQALRTRTETWLQRVGLQLKPSKTRIAQTLAHNTLRADYGSCSTYSMVSPLHPGHPIMGIPPVYSPRNLAAPIATSMMASLTSISSLQTGQR